MERLLNMILRRLMNKGINSGMKAMSKRGQNNSDKTPEQRKMNRQGQQGTRGLRNATRMLRRINKL